MLVLAVPLSAPAQSIDATLRGAETRARQAENSSSTTAGRQEVERVERSLRQLDAANAPYLGATGGEIQQRRVRLNRAETGLTDPGRSNRRATSTGPRTKILPLSPREVTLGLDVFDE